MSERLFIEYERLVRFERDARFDDGRLRQWRAAFIDFGELGDPLRRCILKVFIDAAKIQITRATLWKLDFPHRFERYSMQVMKLLPFGFQECLYGNVVWNVVGCCRPNAGGKQKCGSQELSQRALPER